MDLSNFYESMNAEASEIMARLGGSEVLVKKFLKKFLNDDSFNGLVDALAKEDHETAFRMAHTLKGVTATLGLQNLTSKASEVTEYLRANAVNEAKAAMPELQKEYERVCALIGEIN